MRYHNYSRKFLLDINFTKLGYLCIAEVFGGINFHQYGKGRHMLYVIVNTGQKNSWNKIFVNKTRWRNHRCLQAWVYHGNARVDA